jgi:SAM-dependent methyltransferase
MPSPRPTASDVREFYERYPYPRPIESLDAYRRLWNDPRRRRAEHHLYWPDRPYRDDPSILIAGCGTSQAAKHAVRWPDASVIAIDLSAASVQHTEALKHSANLSNLHVRQLPIERVGELEASFDQIVCTGVLHHLADPDAGLQALRGVLKPDGALHLMVYAPYGRAGIYMLQDFCRRVGIQATAEGIRDLKAALGALPDGHPLGRLLREVPELRQDAALADALLNPQDRAYSVPQLFEFLNRGGLRFGRWVRQAPYSSQCGVVARLPQASTMAALPAAEQYAAAELFRGTMMVHSAIAYRNDHPNPAIHSQITGDAWRDCVPVRVPDTICVQERVPPGAAAVLINRTHTDTDLVLAIDATEKRLFDAIDGERRIGDIAGGADPGAARAFFERLWWYDQIVVDASRH